jgi:hypothetical protein
MVVGFGSLRMLGLFVCAGLPSIILGVTTIQLTKVPKRVGNPKGNVKLTVQNGNAYLVDLYIGTPKQKMQMILDTGSSDMIVQGAGLSCSKKDACAQMRRYHPEKSSTYKADDHSIDLKYQAGTAYGQACRDMVTVGDYSVNWVRFAELVQESRDIESMRADGVLGLAFSGLSKITSPSLLAQLAIEHSDSTKNMFSLYLEPSYYSTNSRLIIGGYDLSLVSKDAQWHYTPVAKVPGYDEYTYWAVSVTSMGLEWEKGEKNHRKEVPICGAKSSCIAIVDSGSSVTEVPSDVWPDFLKALLEGHPDCKSDAGGPYCEHCVVDEFPTLAISMPPGETFYLPPSMYLEFNPGKKEGPCRILFGAADKAGNTDVWVLGGAWIQWRCSMLMDVVSCA